LRFFVPCCCNLLVHQEKEKYFHALSGRGEEGKVTEMRVDLTRLENLNVDGWKLVLEKNELVCFVSNG
jgi:hypothetical protein